MTITLERSRRARILVVDDELPMAQTLSLALVCMGHDAAAYADPHEALEALADGYGHDLVIADRRMPGVAGDTVARWAKALRPELPVILMSAERAPADPSPLVEGVLCEPFSMLDLEVAVNRALGARRRTH